MSAPIVTLRPVEAPRQSQGRKYDRIDPIGLADIAITLSTNPGRWFEIARFEHQVPAGRQAINLARDIKGGRIRALKGAEAMSRTVDGHGVVYACFPAEQPAPTSPEPATSATGEADHSTDVGAGTSGSASDFDALVDAVADRILARLLSGGLTGGAR